MVGEETINRDPGIKEGYERPKDIESRDGTEERRLSSQSEKPHPPHQLI